MALLALSRTKEYHHNDCPHRVCSHTDHVTGLGNARCLDEIVLSDKVLERAHKARLAVIALDVDNFGALNKSIGHLNGNRRLKQIAKCLESHLRHSDDRAIRPGGDEFVVVLHGATIDQATHVAERIIVSVKALEIPGVTMSAGVTSVEISGFRRTDLVGDADFALLEAKRRGKGQAVVFDTSMRPSEQE